MVEEKSAGPRRRLEALVGFLASDEFSLDDLHRWRDEHHESEDREEKITRRAQNPNAANEPLC